MWTPFSVKNYANWPVVKNFKVRMKGEAHYATKNKGKTGIVKRKY